MSKTKIEKAHPLFGLRPNRIFIPVLIGAGFVGYFLYKEFDISALSFFNFNFRMVFWLLVAVLFMAGRDFGYMVRIRLLTSEKLSWMQSFRIIMLWEFTSAVTPSAIGGTSIAIIYVNKEGISLGRSSAVVLATSFLDELYFILIFPIIVAIIGFSSLFNVPFNDLSQLINNEFFYFALVGYTLKLVYVLFLSYGLFFNPRGLKWLLLMIFKLPGLRKWKQGANKAGTEIVNSSIELKHQPFTFWFKAFMATFLSWSSRYMVVNAIILAFFSVSDHVLLFGRQLVMWVMMLVSPTPGGSGFAEYIFTRYLSDLIPVDALSIASVAIGLALIWRLISYYPYLFIGAIILPRWIKKHFVK